MTEIPRWEKEISAVKERSDLSDPDKIRAVVEIISQEITERRLTLNAVQDRAAQLNREISSLRNRLKRESQIPLAL